MTRLQRAVPVLQVTDVARSIDWYVETFGFQADSFPAAPPYLRTSGDLLALAGAVRRVTRVVRGPERMFYGLVEFDVVDPDGYRVCVSGSLPATANVPLASERESAGPEPAP